MRLSLADFLFEHGAQPVLSPSAGPQALNMPAHQLSRTTDYFEIKLYLVVGCDSNVPQFCAGDQLEFGIGGFTNRRFSGPSTADIQVETRGSPTDTEEVLDKVRFKLSRNLELSPFANGTFRGLSVSISCSGSCPCPSAAGHMNGSLERI